MAQTKQNNKKVTQTSKSSKKNAKKKSGKTRSKKSAKSKKAAKVSKIAAAKKLEWPKNVEYLIGSGAVMVLDPHNSNKSKREIYAVNPDKKYVPASILKVITSALALETLGPDYRFKTEFYLTKDNDLWIVGYGDPYLVSEEIALIATHLKQKGLQEVSNIYLDNSFFQDGIILDGNTRTINPYDAFNCALGGNFNTVGYKKDKKGNVSKCDPYTPLTPTTLALAKAYKSRGEVRMNIKESPQKAMLHAGELFQAHLEEAGVSVRGNISLNTNRPGSAKLFHRYLSNKTLSEMIVELLKYSNNFITNQIFLTMGAEVYGAPATLTKSQKVMDVFAKEYDLPKIEMGDGSGLSRKTTVTASKMAAWLAVFEADRYLLDPKKAYNGQVLAKTGTMSGIQTLMGYIEQPGKADEPLIFVILLNGTGYEWGTRDAILEMITKEYASVKE